MKYGIVIISHVYEIAEGVARLLAEIAKDVCVVSVGGYETTEIGTDLTAICEAIEENEAAEILAFYDLGSAKMNLAMAVELATKPVHVYDVALIEGAYVSAALLQSGQTLEVVEEQLLPLKIK